MKINDNFVLNYNKKLFLNVLEKYKNIENPIFTKKFFYNAKYCNSTSTQDTTNMFFIKNVKNNQHVKTSDTTYTFYISDQLGEELKNICNDIFIVCDSLSLAIYKRAVKESDFDFLNKFDSLKDVLILKIEKEYLDGNISVSDKSKKINI